MKATTCECKRYSIEFYSTGLFTKFLNKTRQFFITRGIKRNQEIFPCYIIYCLSQLIN